MEKSEKQKRQEASLDRFLDDLANDARDTSGVSIRDLLEMSVGRVMKARIASGQGEGDSDAVNDMRHIRDWLVGAVLRHDAWLDRCNPEGVPLKLAKFGRLKQIVDEANKAMRRLNTRGVGKDITSEIVHDFGNGYVMVQLKTSAELEAESQMMQHCVGQGAYHGAVEADTTRIFSLRDRHGKAHVTIEVDVPELTVEQVKGKQNDIPRIDYFEMVAEWLNTKDYEFDCEDHPPGFAVDGRGKLVDITKLKEGDEFDGDLKISLSDTPVPTLPRNLLVTGSLKVYMSGLIPGAGKFELPEGLVLGGDLHLTTIHVSQDDEFPGRAVYLDNCVIERLPPRIEQTVTIRSGEIVGDFKRGVVFERLVVISSALMSRGRLLERSTFLNNVNLDGESATAIPDGFRVAGDLKITKASGVFFDGSVEVGRSFVINDSRIEGDPNRLHVGTTLHVHRSKMRMLPNDTVVGTDLVLSSVGDIRTLPRAVKVGGKIRIDDTEIYSLEGRREFAGLSLHRTEVRELEPGTAVRGDLSISNLPMERLPAGLVVEGDLSIGPCPIKRIPSTTRLGGSLLLKGSYVVAVPEGLHIPKDLDISGLGSFRIPPGVTIGRNLVAGGAGIEELPNDFSVHSLLVPGSSLQRLPRRLNIDGDLDVRSTRIDSVPATLSVGGNADFRKTSIRSIPASVFIGGELTVEDHVIVDVPNVGPQATVPRFG